jgi:hypothetical protein
VVKVPGVDELKKDIENFSDDDKDKNVVNDINDEKLCFGSEKGNEKHNA